MVTGAGARRQRRRAFGHQRIEGVEQPEIALRAHRDQRPPQPGLIPAFGALDQAFPHRAAHQFRWQPIELLLVALFEHLGVAGHPQNAGEFA